jgi:hypothetical protein
MRAVLAGPHNSKKALGGRACGVRNVTIICTVQRAFHDVKNLNDSSFARKVVNNFSSSSSKDCANTFLVLSRNYIYCRREPSQCHLKSSIMHSPWWFLALPSFYATTVTATQHVLNANALSTTGQCEVDNSAVDGPDISSGQTSAFQTRPVDPSYIPPGTYDSFERPISEEEYKRQAEHYDQTGLPYYRDREAEKRRTNTPLSVKFFRDSSSQGGQTGHLTKASVCLTVKGSKGIQVESISSLCTVFTFTDEHCMVRSYDTVPALEVDCGYFGPGEFSSSRVDCIAELPA